MTKSKTNWEELAEKCYKLRKEVVTNSNLEKLPAFTCRMDEEELENFMNYLSKESENFYFHKSEELWIGLQKISIGTIVLNIPELTDLFDGFVDKIICKLRYDYDEIDLKYDVKITGYAITRAIEAENMQELYQRIFDGTIAEDILKKICVNKPKIAYEDINYIISFMGIKCFVEKPFYGGTYCSSFKYDRKGINACKEQKNCKICICENFIKKYLIHERYRYARILIKEKVTGFKYREFRNSENYHSYVVKGMFSKYYDNLNARRYPYPYYKINESFFKGMLECKRRGERVLIDFLQLTFEKCRLLYPVLVNNLEAYIIEEEIDSFLDEDNEIWYANIYKPGRLFETTLLYNEEEMAMFLLGLNRLYEKVDKNYEKYMQNIEYFLKVYFHNLKIEHYLVIEESAYKIAERNFFEWYAINLEWNELKVFFETKMFKMDKAASKYMGEHIISITDFFLDGSPFNGVTR